MTKDIAAIKDQLGRAPEKLTQGVWSYFEDIWIEEGPFKISSYTLDDSWIVGTSTNGIVGTNTGTQGGGQQVVGASSRVLTVLRVVNSSNSFRERFRDTDYIDTGATTATIDIVTDFDLTFTTSQTARSEIIGLNSETYSSGKLSVTGTTTENLTGYLSFDNGSNWEQVTLGVEHQATNPNTTGVRWRLDATGNATVTFVKVEYS